MPHRIVVTGAGIITALGSGWQANAEGFRQGRSAFGPITLFDVSRQRTRRGAEIVLPDKRDSRIPDSVMRRLDRPTHMLLLASMECWNQAACRPGDDMPMVIGTTSGGMTLGEDYFRGAITTPLKRKGQPTRAANYQSQVQVRCIHDALGFKGTTTIVSNACASGANAIGHAWEMLRRGKQERILAGGYDALSLLVFSGFDSLQALSPTTCRPFDAKRDGLALGEGAAMVMMETLDSALKRGATILGELIGYGAAVDLHHLTQPHPQGDAALETMSIACKVAGISPEEVDYVNAHGTGTILNDASEAMAINRWAGEHAARLPVSSTKSSIGHLLGAAGAVEAVICLMVLKEQWLPPETGIETVDPLCRFNLVRQPSEASVKVALSNSFGFGGANATLVFRRWA